MFCLNCSLKLHFYYTFLSVFSDIFLWRVFNVRAQAIYLHCFGIVILLFLERFIFHFLAKFKVVKSNLKRLHLSFFCKKKHVTHLVPLLMISSIFFSLQKKYTTKRSSLHDQSYQVGNTGFWHVLIHGSAYITRHQNHKTYCIPIPKDTDD